MKKFAALFTAAVMMLSSAALPAAEAAEQTFKPWELYSVPWGETDTNRMGIMKSYNNGIQWFVNDPSMADKRGSLALIGNEFISQTGWFSEEDKGTVAVAFEAPYDSIWNLEAQFSNLIDVNFGVGVDVGITDVYKLPAGQTVLSGEYKLDVGDQMLHATGGQYYADPIDESLMLKKGETLVFHTRPSDNNTAPTIALSFRINQLEITDENNPEITYDLFNVLNTTPEYEIDKRIYRLDDYTNVKQYADNPWNMYFARHSSVEPDITPANWLYADDDSSKNDEGVQDTFDDAAHDYKIYHSANEGGQIRYNSKGTVPLYVLRAVDDSAVPNNYTNPVISWTAPHDGDWIVEFRVRNEWNEPGLNEPNPSTHWLGYIDENNAFRTLQIYNGPSVAECRTGAYASGEMKEFKCSLNIKAGEEICLVNQAPSFYSHSLVELKFINADDTTEVYSSNNLGKSAIAGDNGGDSPFDLFGLMDCETYDRTINNFMKKTAYSSDDVNIGIDGGYPMSVNKENGTLNIASSDTSMREGVMFKFPEDGKYVMTLNVHNNADTNDGIIQYWYYDSSDFSGLLTVNNLIKYQDYSDLNALGENPVINKVYDASEGDVVYLSFGTGNQPINYAVDVQFEKIEDQSSFDFFADGLRVSDFSDIAANAGKTLNCSYKFNNRGAETPFIVLTAVYDKDGHMLSAAVSEQMTAPAGELVIGNLLMTLPQEDLVGGSMKAFIWRDINDITPLADAYSLNR